MSSFLRTSKKEKKLPPKEITLDLGKMDKEKKVKKAKKDKRQRKPRPEAPGITFQRSGATTSTSEQTSDTSSNEGGSKNEQIIEEYVTAVNTHASVEELLQFYASEKVKVKFDDAPTMTAIGLQNEIRNLYKSFNDFKFGYESIKEVRPGEVLVEDLCVTGTHNGEPYKFAMFPPVPASGRFVVLDSERIIYTLNKEGKIVHEEVIALGNLTGPPGMYTSIGGKI